MTRRDIRGKAIKLPSGYRWLRLGETMRSGDVGFDNTEHTPEPIGAHTVGWSWTPRDFLPIARKRKAQPWSSR